jgi:hypothetical protein
MSLRLLMKRRLVVGTALVLAVGAGGAGAYLYLVRKGILRYNKYDRREEGTLSVGQTAPDLKLDMFEGAPVRLSGLWNEKPVLLIFGSCT